MKYMPLFLLFVAMTFTTGIARGQEVSLDLSTLESLDLKTARTIALKGNPSLQATRLRIEKTMAIVKQREATFFPMVDAATSLSRIDNATRSGTPDQMAAWQSSLTASLTLFDGWKRTNALAYASSEASISRKAEQEARRQLMLHVGTSYFAVQTAIENATIARSDRDYNARLLKEAKARYDAGAGSLSDLLNFKIAISNARSTLDLAQLNVTTARSALAVLMGIEEAQLPRDLRLTPMERLTDTRRILPSFQDLMDQAIAQRPDFAQASLKISQADNTIAMARAGYYPTIRLKGSITGERNSNPAYGGDDVSNSIGIDVTFNLFSGGKTRFEVAEAKAAKRQAQYTLKETRITIAREVTQTVAAVVSARNQMLLQAQTVDFTRQSRNLIEQEYRAGTSTIVKLNEAQNRLVKARSSLVSARVALFTAWETLDAVTGTNIRPMEVRYENRKL